MSSFTSYKHPRVWYAKACSDCEMTADGGSAAAGVGDRCQLLRGRTPTDLRHQQTRALATEALGFLT